MLASRAFVVTGLVTLAVNLALFVAFLALHSGSAYSSLWDAWIPNLVMVAPIAACFACALRGGPQRVAAVWLGIGMICWAAGNVIFVGWTQFQADPPVPSPADFAYLAFYVCVATAMVSLARVDRGAVPRSLWLDGALGAVGAATVLAATLNSVLSRPAGDLGEVAVSAGYTIADLLLVAMLCGLLAVRGARGGSLWLWMAGGLAVFCAADVVYALQVTSNTFAIGTVLAGLWATGITILAVAIWQPDRPRQLAAVRSAAVLAVPMLATLAAVVVLVVSSFTHMSVIVVGLAAVTLLLAVVRTFVSFGQVKELATARRQAFSDDLTGLGNRRCLFERGEQLRRATRDADRLVLLMVDLDNFKDVNDALGHQSGDELLRDMSRRLAARTSHRDLLVRLGGDEFALLITVDPGVDVRHIAGRILARVSEPFVIDGASVRIDARIGIAETRHPMAGIAELLRRADLAMYAAKAGTERVQLYDLDLDAANRAKLKTIQDLEVALASHQFVLHYQPKIDVRTGATIGAEALVRWQHPTRGLLAPDAFLTVVEQSGMMGTLTRVVLGDAVSQLAAWRRSGLGLSVAVNLSASDLLDEQLATGIVGLLDEHDVPVAALELEITESVLMADPARARAVLDDLSRAGLRIAIDDYGTGYSSLAYLRDLPVDELKIDRSFVARIATDDRSTAIVSSTIELAHALGMKVVAEGVEDEQTLHVLGALDCDFAQGYHFSRPLPADAFEAWVGHRAPEPELSHVA